MSPIPKGFFECSSCVSLTAKLQAAEEHYEHVYAAWRGLADTIDPEGTMMAHDAARHLVEDRDRFKSAFDRMKSRAEAAEAEARLKADLLEGPAGALARIAELEANAKTWAESRYLAAIGEILNNLQARIEEAEAEVARLKEELGAHRRIILGDYVGFQNGGGPNEAPTALPMESLAEPTTEEKRNE